MSDENDVIRRLTEGDSLPQEVERHDVVIRQAEGPNPPDLLQQIREDIKDSLAELVPIAGKTAGKYVGAKGEEAVARVQEIKARIHENISKVELERQRLIQQRDEASNAHEERMEELKIQRLHERTEALRQSVDCIVKLKASGVVVSLKVIRKVQKTMTDLTEGE